MESELDGKKRKWKSQILIYDMGSKEFLVRLGAIELAWMRVPNERRHDSVHSLIIQTSLFKDKVSHDTILSSD